MGERSENNHYICGDRRQEICKHSQTLAHIPSLQTLKAMQLMSVKLTGKEEQGTRWGVPIKLFHKEGADMKNRLCCEVLQSDNLQTCTEHLGPYSLGQSKGYTLVARCPLNWSICLKMRHLPYRDSWSQNAVIC